MSLLELVKDEQDDRDRAGLKLPTDWLSDQLEGPRFHGKTYQCFLSGCSAKCFRETLNAEIMTLRGRTTEEHLRSRRSDHPLTVYSARTLSRLFHEAGGTPKQAVSFAPARTVHPRRNRCWLRVCRCGRLSRADRNTRVSFGRGRHLNSTSCPGYVREQGWALPPRPCPPQKLNTFGPIFAPVFIPRAFPKPLLLSLLYRPRILGQWFDGIRFYAAASSPTRSRRTWAGLR